MALTAKVTSKGQVTIPQEIRKRLNIEMGSVLVFEPEGQRAVIRTAKTLQDYRAFLKGRRKKADLVEARRVARAQIARRALSGGLGPSKLLPPVSRRGR